MAIVFQVFDKRRQARVAEADRRIGFNRGDCFANGQGSLEELRAFGEVLVCDIHETRDGQFREWQRIAGKPNFYEFATRWEK